MIILYILLSVLFLNAILYFFILLPPKRKKNVQKCLLCDYAHRGLHKNGIPENSLAAFERACEHGYGIELDVQLSADGTVMVFHDYSLLRMTGREEKLSNLNVEELQTLSLAGTAQTIPTLKEVLELVDGRVPLLIELKGEDLDTTLCPKLAEHLRNYKGAYCLESFNPILVRSIKKELPDAFCGLLYTNVCREKKKHSLLNILLSAMILNVVARPHFIAYNHFYRKALPVTVTTRLYKAPRLIWTVKSQEDYEIAHALGEHVIFEQFEP